MRYILVILSVLLFTSCEKYGCECGDVIVDCNDSDADGLYNFTVKNHCSGNIREFEFPTCGDQFEQPVSQNLINANQNKTKVYCSDAPW